MFAGNFAPAGWAFCSGQLLPISENEGLFNVIGTTYGGDGQQTFALPNLGGRLPMHKGQGPGLPSSRTIGELAGAESETLTVQRIPSHSHPLLASSDTGTLPDPGDHVPARSHTANVFMYLEDVTNTNMSASSIGSVGGNQPHENLQPFLCVNFIIQLYGFFPSQT
jgi:microcystin-dependent protein